LVQTNNDLKCIISSLSWGGSLLAGISPSDEKWDNFRKQADKFKILYRGTVYDRYADRIEHCSELLEFTQVLNPDTGEIELKLKSARFCRVPRCPVCQWRRSLMWRAKAFKVLPRVFETHPSARFIFLTLTVRNCQLQDLRSTLAHMNKSWVRLVQRKQFPAIGWLRAVEVTRVWDCYDRGKFVGRHGSTWVDDWEKLNGRKLHLLSTDECHPHFHCLLMVKNTYFTGTKYLSHEKWVELWQKSLRVDYPPKVNVQALKSLTGANQGMLEAVLETIKYSVKPSDVLRSRIVTNGFTDQDWLVELTKQLYKTKSIATGGLLKDYLQELEEEPQDLIHADDLLEDELMSKSVSLYFSWNEHMRRYMEYPVNL
jgi:plasmid rolling circle replication initiator protein Rep